MNQITLMPLEPCESRTTRNPPIPIGWYAIAWSNELRRGEVKPVTAFARELVLFRTRSGKAVVQDPYCPHMGAHLGHEGRVVGESIACPFHGWQFDASGACVEIPYCSEIPERAQVRSWQVHEVNEMIFVWYHPGGAPPAWQVRELPEFTSPDWSESRHIEFDIPVHVQDMCENTCDPVHFKYVHQQPDVPPAEVGIDADGRIMTMTLENRFAAVPIVLTATVHNIGLAEVRTAYGPGAEMLTYSSSLPVDENRTITRWSLTVSNAIVDMAGDQHINGIIAGLRQDLPIWRNKVHKHKPVFCKADTSLVQFRKWARQFYVV